MKTPRRIVDSRGHVRRSAQERRKLIEAYERSGLGKAAFCRRHKLHLGTFCGWFKKKREFVEVSLPEVASERKSETSVGLRIELPRGVRVEVYDPQMLKSLSLFIREVCAC